jgi:hypothetical protein
MSNTSSITPYESVTTATVTTGDNTNSGIAEGITTCIGGAAVAGLAVAAWLCDETDREKKLKAEARQTRLRQQVQSVKNSVHLDSGRSGGTSLTQMDLKIRKADPLVQAAISLGFSPAPLTDSLKPSARRPFVLLENPKGERIAITKNANQRIAIHTSKPEVAARIVKQHSMERLANYFNTHNFNPATVQLPNGETQVIARGTMSPQGLPVVRTEVKDTGELAVDIDCLNGNACERIASEIAKAVGGEVVSSQRKPEYYAKPGEVVKPRVRL